MEKVLKDRIAFSDDKAQHIKMPSMKSHGLWAKTEIMGSYDDMEVDNNGIFKRFVKKIPTGVSSLGETLFRTETAQPKWTTSNMVPIGGCRFAMELLFGVKDTQIEIPTVYNNKDTMNIGLPDSTEPLPTYDVPDGTKSIIYNNGNFVQLFGIGITGTAENDITVHPVDYTETSIALNKPINAGDEVLTLEGVMVPFRHTVSELKAEDKLKYFGKKLNDGDVVSYYLKRFDQDPVITHIWKSNEALIENSAITSNNGESDVIESFTEIHLKITKEDVKEWFISLGQEDMTRINTIALFTGQYVKAEDGTIGDYRDVRMFSKLNIPTEYLSLTKDLNLVYRVYTS
jgi:hypothetical protein